MVQLAQLFQRSRIFVVQSWQLVVCSQSEHSQARSVCRLSLMTATTGVTLTLSDSPPGRSFHSAALCCSALSLYTSISGRSNLVRKLETMLMQLACPVCPGSVSLAFSFGWSMGNRQRSSTGIAQMSLESTLYDASNLVGYRAGANRICKRSLARQRKLCISSVSCNIMSECKLFSYNVRSCVHAKTPVF